MRNILLKLCFDGTNFHGYQIQKNAHTIEAEITNILNKLTGESVKLVGCGRTDAGVHAYEYFANFHTFSKIGCENLKSALNSLLNPSISIISVLDVDSKFNARFNVLEKTYVYRILNSKTPNPFENRYSHKYGGELDILKMKKACEQFVGTHDFSSHKSKGTDTKTSVRQVFDCHIETSGDIIEINITANGFLYNMARTIAGTILLCGTGKIDYIKISDILLSKDRTKAGPTLPANGLFMKKTLYDTNFGDDYVCL